MWYAIVKELKKEFSICNGLEEGSLIFDNKERAEKSLEKYLLRDKTLKIVILADIHINLKSTELYNLGK